MIEDGETGDEAQLKPEPIWDGVTQAETLNEWAQVARARIADCGRAYDWPGLLAALAEHPEFINSSCPGGQSWYAPLHQAAHGGAPLAIVERLLAAGAWRTLRTAQDERAVDTTQRRGHTLLSPILTPVIQRDIPAADLRSIQVHFHTVIRGRADQFVREHALRLPELEVLLELQTPKLWFAVPGMYGGFHFWLEPVMESWVLTTDSWCRIAGGSGQRHIISPHGSLLIAEGFV